MDVIIERCVLIMIEKLLDVFAVLIIFLTLVLGALVFILSLMYIGTWGASFFTGVANIVFWVLWTFVTVGALNGISTVISKRVSN